MPDYSDPAVWAQFLSERGIQGKIPPPPQRLFQSTTLPHEQVANDWVDQHVCASARRELRLFTLHTIRLLQALERV